MRRQLSNVYLGWVKLEIVLYGGQGRPKRSVFLVRFELELMPPIEDTTLLFVLLFTQHELNTGSSADYSGIGCASLVLGGTETLISLTNCVRVIWCNGKRVFHPHVTRFSASSRLFCKSSSITRHLFNSPVAHPVISKATILSHSFFRKFQQAIAKTWHSMSKSALPTMSMPTPFT